MGITGKILGRLTVVAIFGFSMLTAMAQQDLRATLFAQTDDALKAANEARANVLAPKNYAEATKRYRDAEDKLARNRSIESIKKDLEAAAQSLRLAVDATRLAGITLTAAIQARNDAEEANAGSFAAEQWQDAEEKFASAAMRLEDGNVNAARSRGSDAEKLYRTAELMAIKANYLDETRRLIALAKKDRVQRDAPITLAKAEALLSQAEKSLSDNRYDTDEPRSLARQAKYEVKHAMHLASSLRRLRDRDITPENFALMSEQPIEQIASALDLVAELDQGHEVPTQQITAKIQALQKDAYELSERRGQILDLEREINELEGKLGMQSQRLAAQEQQRQKFRQIEAMFGPDEAQVFTQGQNVLVRPIGLVFASGSSQIETQYFALLRKVQDAIRVFPNSLVIVEGHTDSFGGDETNLTLSRDRAEAVRAYLLANMRDLSPEEVQFVGFGESRPVANNENVEGRAKNRRIDLVIRPKTTAGANNAG
jgi:outer membrane protein OmpA-like peptidoglycan-associated protein